MNRVKKQVDGGRIFRAATGDWTFALNGERFWRQVHFKTEAEVMQALQEARHA